jgi:hypothetical protein
MGKRGITIRILHPVEREAHNGELWKFKPGDIEEDVDINEYGWAVLDFG